MKQYFTPYSEQGEKRARTHTRTCFDLVCWPCHIFLPEKALGENTGLVLFIAVSLRLYKPSHKPSSADQWSCTFDSRGASISSVPRIGTYQVLLHIGRTGSASRLSCTVIFSENNTETTKQAHQLIARNAVRFGRPWRRQIPNHSVQGAQNDNDNQASLSHPGRKQHKKLKARRPTNLKVQHERLNIHSIAKLDKRAMAETHWVLDCYIRVLSP